jgi:GNAT superfamily N-acetyltransferase
VNRALTTAWRFVAGLERPSRSANRRRARARGDNAAEFRIRDATAADIPALSRLHVIAWNATYKPLLVRGPSVAIREQQWRQKFASAAPGWFCLVVERPDGRLVGFAQGNPSSHSEYGGQLDKIYFLREYQRLGLGRRLLRAVAQRFLNDGTTSMWLFGDARNPSSRAWVAMGGQKVDDDPGSGNYGWKDLTRLAISDKE